MYPLDTVRTCLLKTALIAKNATLSDVKLVTFSEILCFLISYFREKTQTFPSFSLQPCSSYMNRNEIIANCVRDIYECFVCQSALSVSSFRCRWRTAHQRNKKNSPGWDEASNCYDRRRKLKAQLFRTMKPESQCRVMCDS